MATPDVVEGNGCFRISGDLVFATVTPLINVGEAVFRDRQETVFDFQDVGYSDSAGLALLLEWLDRAKKRGVQLHYRNLPESLLSVAHLSNVDDLLVGS